MTFSIVACDLKEQAWGVAVASKFLSVGAVVPFAQANIGRDCDSIVCQHIVWSQWTRVVSQRHVGARGVR